MVWKFKFKGKTYIAFHKYQIPYNAKVKKVDGRKLKCDLKQGAHGFECVKRRRK